ncbi:MAG: hypothetical protein BGO54_13835 [Sphingobacteriales bacterium 46-32]|nr:MAG: hypothetical protein BGO54_13835 [Sphingobacteriales bacterium 46-32]
MKRFIFNELLICSMMERKAKKVTFDPVRTLIFGKNDTGKSSLLKSLFMTFGAAPAKINSKWKQLNPISLVRFSVDGDEYAILKHGKSYAIFDGSEDLIKTFDSVTNGLAPFLADLANFKLKLPDKQGKNIIPPPAFMFLPFYVDQDSSWAANWNAFSGMQQFKAPRLPVIQYHTGIRGNEYYDAKGELAQFKDKLEKLREEKKITDSILANIKDKFTSGDFNLDVEEFKEEIRQLLVECQVLKNREEQLKEKLIDLNNNKIVVESQIEITQLAQKEAKSDYSFASTKLDHLVECPTCGAEYENSFAERFEIAQDSDRCAELLEDLFNELKEIETKVEKENGSLTKTMAEIEKIELILQKKKGDVILRDLIENAGRTEVKRIFDQKISELTKEITENTLKQGELETKIKSLEDKKRTQTILSFYRKEIARNLHTLQVESVAEKDYKNIYSKISDTGSSLPRALTAYYFAIFETILKYSSAVYCPLVIDSPNQQALDYQNIDKVLSFINNNQPKDTQLILGLEELYDVDFNCPVIELKEKYHLLQQTAYDDVRAELDPYIKQLFQSSNLLF